MSVKEILEKEDRDIRVQKAPGRLHLKLERLMSKREFLSGHRPTKSDLVTELLMTHPLLKSL